VLHSFSGRSVVNVPLICRHNPSPRVYRAFSASDSGAVVDGEDNDGCCAGETSTSLLDLPIGDIPFRCERLTGCQATAYECRDARVCHFGTHSSKAQVYDVGLCLRVLCLTQYREGSQSESLTHSYAVELFAVQVTVGAAPDLVNQAVVGEKCYFQTRYLSALDAMWLKSRGVGSNEGRESKRVSGNLC
jgi:hypothetical protein